MDVEKCKKWDTCLFLVCCSGEFVEESIEQFVENYIWAYSRSRIPVAVESARLNSEGKVSTESSMPLWEVEHFTFSWRRMGSSLIRKRWVSPKPERQRYAARRVEEWRAENRYWSPAESAPACGVHVKEPIQSARRSIFLHLKILESSLPLRRIPLVKNNCSGAR